MIVVEKRIIRRIEQCQSSHGIIYGHVLDNDVYRIEDATPQPEQCCAGLSPIGVWSRPHAVAVTADAPGPVMIVLRKDNVRFLSRINGRPAAEMPAIIIDLGRDLFRRLGGVVDTAKLQDVRIVIGGCGSLGSGIASLLVTAGVTRLILVDPDRLEPHNIIRHVCGVSDIGRLKVHALADRLLDKNPHLQIEVAPNAISKDNEHFAQAVSRSDLVIAATDDPQAQLAINMMAVAAGKPALYVGAYNFGFGGEVIRVIPRQSACLRCIYDATAELFQRVEPGEDGQTKAYDADRGHPAMWIDVGIVAHLAARMGIETLLDQHDPDQNLVGDYLLWGNRRLWVFQHPLDNHWLNIPRNPLCPVCGDEDALDASLATHGINRQQAEALAASVLATATDDASTE
jgi:molybdopterin/thiamine biosynthesis adenylyltransferase